MKEYTENELKYKAEAYCSATEHCPFEVMTKLSQWGADEAMSERILLHLQKNAMLILLVIVVHLCATNIVLPVGGE